MVSSAGGEAASSKEEARKGRCERPRPGAEAGAGPEAADPAAGAAGEVGQERVKHTKIKKVNHFLFWKERKLKAREYKSISKKLSFFL